MNDINNDTNNLNSLYEDKNKSEYKEKVLSKKIIQTKVLYSKNKILENYNKKELKILKNTSFHFIKTNISNLFDNLGKILLEITKYRINYIKLSFSHHDELDNGDILKFYNIHVAKSDDKIIKGFQKVQKIDKILDQKIQNGSDIIKQKTLKKENIGLTKRQCNKYNMNQSLFNLFKNVNIKNDLKISSQDLPHFITQLYCFINYKNISNN